ncbi:hypothetical protein GCM10020295_78610 [Streptomyces cinereospinus]
MKPKSEVAIRPGGEQREGDATEGAEPGAAVDLRGFFQFRRDGGDEAAQHDDGEGEGDHEVHQRQGGEPVEHVGVAGDDVDRDDQ